MITSKQLPKTDKIKIIFELLLPDTISFDQDLYISVWKKCVSLFEKGLIESTELIIIGCMIQTRTLPKGKSLGAFTNKTFFNILERCNTLMYKILFEDIKEIGEQDLNYLLHSTEQL